MVLGPSLRTSAAALLSACQPVRAQDVSSFDACIDDLRLERPQPGPWQVSAQTFDTHRRAALDMRPIIRAASESQPKFKLPVWVYLARLIDPQRIADGKEVLAALAVALQAIASRRDVDAATVVAVFRVEADNGRVEGRQRVIDATLSRRTTFVVPGPARWIDAVHAPAPEGWCNQRRRHSGIGQQSPSTFAG